MWHRSGEGTLGASKCSLCLSPYSPDFNPIEKLWSKIKALLRRFKARTVNQLPDTIQNAFLAVTPANCSG